ncbi:FkbM family methyltransferase [Flammeovirga aprica]|uniref:FkbM family methyltransferase n=1 Tax=Flammeovirga aprica JL-4 TaxID=694437 RepID=A0A7X9RYI9_9BACT|nr:FkbM family methyltransferase [Flammeovirga aprica]NME71029.1 FkbM family methyltransferase [Flammeovirga aprica JL-4]
MLDYIKNSLKRKKARRVTAKYPSTIKEFNLSKDGVIEFAVWQNPLYAYTDEITQANIDFFRQFVKEGDAVIDIGANVGDVTIPLAIAAGAKGTTLAFDPNPYVYDILEVNAGLNKDKTNIVPILRAISDVDEEYYFISSEASFANGGLSKTTKSDHGKYIYENKVKGVNLSGYLEREYPQLDISLIKVDTEGFDKEIIKSISDFIKKQRPVLIAESFERNSDADKKELFQVISDLDYDVFYFEDFASDAKVEPITAPEGMLKWKGTFDIYAVPR